MRRHYLGKVFVVVFVFLVFLLCLIRVDALDVAAGCHPAQKTSDNRIIYEQVAASASWSPRYGHTTVAFKGRIWVLGGTDSDPTKAGVLFNLESDVWSSADGVNWIQVTAVAPWPGRYLHNSLVFDEKIWVFGGLTRYAPPPRDNIKNPKVNANDVWCSEDGVNWTQITEAAPWQPRHVFTSVVHNNRMWVIGGAGKEYYNDVWSSEDGLNWTRMEGCGERFAPRKNLTSVSFNGRIWVLAGVVLARGANRKGNHLVGDVWSSADGVNWIQVTAAAPWSARDYPGIVVYNNELWLTGGKLRESFARDIWHSPDGFKWVKEKAPIWPPRFRMPVVFRDSVWMLGGRTNKESLNDVWRFIWK